MSFWSDIRHGTRRLVADPSVSAASIVALALALAAVNTIFTLANGIFLRPLPFEEPDRIVLLGTTRTSDGNRIDAGLSYADWQEWRAGTRTLSSLGVFTDLRPLDAVIDADQWEGRLLSKVFGLVALLALTLATVGVYAVTAVAVSRRTREIGVRMALGARARHVYALVTRGATAQVAAGIALGLLGADAVRGVLDSILSEIDAADAVTLAAAPALMAGVALIACLLPASRAVAVDPARSLRAE